MFIYLNRFTQNIGLPTELFLPKTITNHRNRMTSRLGFFFRQKATAQSWLQPKYFKGIRRDRLRPGPSKGVVASQMGQSNLRSDHSRKDVRQPRKILNVGIRTSI